jgi:hypothetical protein
MNRLITQILNGYYNCFDALQIERDPRTGNKQADC